MTIGHNDLPGPRPVPRARDAEPDRVRGHLPAARGAGRPVHAQGARRLPGPRRGADRRRALARAAAAAAAGALDRGAAALQAQVGQVYVDPALVSWAVDLATATRKPAEAGLDAIAPYISYGASPRGPISVIAAARALARAPRPRLRARRPTSRRSSATRSATGSCSPTRRSRRRSPPTRCSTQVLEAIAPPQIDLGRARRRGVKGLVAAVGRRADARPPGPRADHGREPRGARAGDRPPRRRPARGRLPLGLRRASAPSCYQVRPYEAGRRRPPDRLERHRPHRRRRTSGSSSPSGCSSPGSCSTASASMAFGTAERRKADVAEGVALAVGHAATRRGNRLGLVAFGAGGPALAPAAAGPPRAAADARGAARGAGRASGGLGRGAARSLDGLARPALARRDRLGLPRPDRLAQRRCCASPAGIRRSRSRSATRASRSSPTSASCGSSIPRPAASCASTRATAACASASPPPRPRSATASCGMLAVGRRPPRRALDRGRLAARARRLPASGAR